MSCDESQIVSPTRIVWDNTGEDLCVINVPYNFVMRLKI